ncbi:MAG: HEPN domain-containing protein [Bacteroidetes bacterium]|nr:HEPN domain-containing protein [Bacteroidota bacterium]
MAASREAQMHDALRAARTLIQAGLPRDAVNRVYYAIYYRMVALLLLRRMEPSTHSGTLTLFSREFVKEGLVPRELARIAHHAFERRLEADYTGREVAPNEAEALLAQAHRFVDETEPVMNDLLREL